MSLFLITSQTVYSASPWKVTFVGEQAIDAGGPSRELYGEISTSIFDRRAGLTLSVSNHEFIPDPKSRKRDEFEAVGIFLMVCVRTGSSTAMPFTRLVWKFLTNRTIDESDVCLADPALSETFRGLRSGGLSQNWVTTDWEGGAHVLRASRSPVGHTEVDEYFAAVIKYRIGLLEPNLTLIKNGFVRNGHLSARSLRVLFPGDLRRLVEGISIITATDILRITQFDRVPEQLVRYFRDAVDRLTDDERVLLLRFTTGKTRLPIVAEMKDQFTLRVVYQPDAAHGVDPMLRASTCFNRIYLGDYSSAENLYRKMVWSIQSTTMDNQ
jgi:hypothetical protein